MIRSEWTEWNGRKGCKVTVGLEKEVPKGERAIHVLKETASVALSMYDLFRDVAEEEIGQDVRIEEFCILLGQSMSKAIQEAENGRPGKERMS